MKQIVLIQIFVLFTVFQSVAQKTDQLPYAFYSDYEAQVVSSYLGSEYIDIVPLFLAVDPENNTEVEEKVQKEIDRLVKRLCKRNLERKSPTKMIKRTYYAVHRRKLFNFKPNANFTDVFKKGEYNCVTASALVAYVFQEIGIDYSIRLAPGHVFVIAESGDSRVYLETTDPINGFIKDNKFLENKLKRYVPDVVWGAVSGTTNTENGEESSDSFFLNAEEITLQELAGIQFYNGGVTALEEKDFQLAFHYFRVANDIYANEQSTLAMRIALMNLLYHNDFSKPTDLDYLEFLAANSASDNDRSIVLRSFQKISENHLFSNHNADTYREAYFKLYTATSDKALKSLLQGFYLYDLGRYTLEYDSAEKAIRLLEKAAVMLPGIDEIEQTLSAAYLLNKNFD
ncbi:MAG: hypothetical protein AAF502_13105 [Bacteroidota bacterium]